MCVLVVACGMSLLSPHSPPLSMPAIPLLLYLLSAFSCMGQDKQTWAKRTSMGGGRQAEHRQAVFGKSVLGSSTSPTWFNSFFFLPYLPWWMGVDMSVLWW